MPPLPPLRVRDPSGAPSGAPARWSGRYNASRLYNGGEIVYDPQNGFVWTSKHNQNAAPMPKVIPDPMHAWAFLGPMGASPGKVLHPWHPRPLQYPVNVQDLSEVATVCLDCWKDADYRNAFDPKVHLYIIKELGYGL